MAMVIKNNLEVSQILNTLNKNFSAFAKSLAKVSNGQKINSAQDNASGYTISEKMREQIRTLQQDSQNVQNGSALFKIADGGINSIVEELRNLKELAINSANDTNTDIDRATIQKVFNQKMANINDIATTTNYNGKTLLDGTYSKKILQVVDADRENAIRIYDDGYNIDADGVYMLTKNFTGTVNVNAKNVKILQEDSSTALKNVSIVGSADGNLNLSIKNLNINNTENKSVIRFNGSNNTLTFAETSKFVMRNNLNNQQAVINVGNGLTLEDGGNGTLDIKYFGNLTATAIGIDCTTSGGVNGGGTNGYYVNSYITVNSGNYNLFVEKGGGGIGMADNAHLIGNIEIHGGNITATANYGSAVGCGSGMMTGDLIIGNATVNATSTDGAGIGSGSYGSRFDAGDWLDGNIIIGNGAKITAKSGTGAGVGAGKQANVNGTLSISSKSKISSTGYNGFYNEKTAAKPLCDGLSGAVTNVKFEDVEVTPGKNGYDKFKAMTTTKFNPLKIHHGPKANQATNFYIEDMHTKSLGTENLIDNAGNILNDSDLARYDALSYDENLQNAWLETLKSAQNKTLDDISVTTKKNANIAIRVIDGAIEYALDEATQIGSYLQRLEYTDANVTTMGENVQAAESTIRDADMAKEMTEYTKYNVLTQSAQAMLAQANQNSSAVLSLL